MTISDAQSMEGVVGKVIKEFNKPKEGEVK